ncbi:MAG: phage scaffolding protein [Bacilli bacterium]|nr:phage scaffolding protein [Bacilli bacterium]
MKDFLENLEIGEGKVKLSKEEIKFILAEHGKTVTTETEKVKTSLNKEIDTYKTTISNLENQLENVPDSKELEGLKKEIADMKTAEQKRIADEKAKQEDEILTNNIISAFGDKKFTSDYVKNGLIADIKSELSKVENKGKGIGEIFEALTKDKSGLFENPNAPADMPGMGEEIPGEPDNLDEMSFEQYKAWRKNN